MNQKNFKFQTENNINYTRVDKETLINVLDNITKERDEVLCKLASGIDDKVINDDEIDDYQSPEL